MTGTGRTITLTVDGRTIPARAGQNVAASLLAAGIRMLRRSPHAGTPRGAFCMMGACQDCVATIDGMRVRACMTEVADGMIVRLDAAR